MRALSAIAGYFKVGSSHWAMRRRLCAGVVIFGCYEIHEATHAVASEAIATTSIMQMVILIGTALTVYVGGVVADDHLARKGGQPGAGD